MSNLVTHLMLQTTFFAMGSAILIALDAAGPAPEAALAAAPVWFAGWERRLSRFRPDSELCALNARAGTGWAPVSPTLWDALDVAIDAAQRSDGLVAPNLLDAVERAGYDRDFAQLQAGSSGGLPPRGAPLGRVSAGEHRGAAPAAWRLIRRDAARRAVALPAGMRLDLGGSAKGWAVDQAARRLAEHGPALVDAGGDIAVSGSQADGAPWPIAVADPLGGEPLDLLLLAEGGVATSGRDHRRWRQGDVERHHLIDPRTGAPAVTDLLSVTVVAPDVQLAELAAKVIMILGCTEGMRWLAARPALAALLVSEGGRVIRSPSWSAFTWGAGAGT